MSLRERLSGIWLISMTLLALCAYTVFFVAQMWLNLLHALFLGLVILQVIALIMYLWGTEKLKRPWQRVVYRVLYLSSFAVIPAFLFILRSSLEPILYNNANVVVNKRLICT